MPSIPYESQVDARTGRGGGARIQNAYNADTFGAAQGEAMQRGAAALQDFADTSDKIAERKAREQAIYHQATFDFTDEENRIKQEVGPDAEGYKDKLKTAYLNKVSDSTNGIEDDMARKMTKDALLSRLPAYIEQAGTYQQKTMEDTTKMRTNAVLSTNANRVASDPSWYDTAVKLDNEIIDLQPNLTQADKEGMKLANTYNTTKTLFNAKLGLAKTPAELDAIRAEMSGEEWQSKLLSRDYEDLLMKVDSAKKTYQNQVSSEVKAQIGSFEEQVKDPTKPLPPERISELQAQTVNAADPALARRVGRLARDNQIMQVAKKLTPMQIAEAKANIQSKVGKSPSGAFAEQAYRASALTGMSVPFLINMSGLEYKPGGPEKNPDSSATGPVQFIESTWMDLMKNPADAAALGVREGMTREEILALRSQPEAAFLAGAIYAKQNKASLEAYFKRSVTDTELYFAHFLGPEGAKPIINAMQTNPETIARSLVNNDAYEANKNVFTDKATGRDFTVAEIYTKRAQAFSRNVDVVDFEDLKVYDNAADAIKKAETAGTMLNYATGVGVLDQVIPLDQPGGFESRSATVAKVNEYYGMDIPPFTPEEMTYIGTQLNGNLDQKLSVLDSISRMDRPMANKAFKQLKQSNPAVAQAGQLIMQGDRTTATSILSGVQRLRENPSLPSSVQFSSELSSVQFAAATGQATALWDPADTEAMKQAADAYYLDSLAVSGGKYSDSKYREAVSKITGFSLGKVNGYETILPRGVAVNDVNQFLDNANAVEIMSVSKTGTRPMVTPDGKRLSTADLEDILPAARLVNVGPDTYRLYPPVGNMPYLSGQPADKKDGQPVKILPYDIELTRDKIDMVKKRIQMARAKGAPQFEVGPML